MTYEEARKVFECAHKKISDFMVNLEKSMTLTDDVLGV